MIRSRLWDEGQNVQQLFIIDENASSSRMADADSHAGQSEFGRHLEAANSTVDLVRVLLHFIEDRMRTVNTAQVNSAVSKCHRQLIRRLTGEWYVGPKDCIT